MIGVTDNSRAERPIIYPLLQQSEISPNTYIILLSVALIGHRKEK